MPFVTPEGHRASARHAKRATQIRSLKLESLEDRNLLAITVDTLLDVNDAGDGLTTLREAIAAATVGEVIDFSVAGQIDLDSSLGALTITNDLTIYGPGADLLKIDGGDAVRAFIVDDGNTSNHKSVAIWALTIANGYTSSGDGTTNAGRGGGILSYEDLTLSQVYLHDNESNADGGAVWIRYGDLTIVESTLSGNVAAYKGGGIYARDGDSQITSSTLSGNSVSIGASAGGAIYARSGLHTISHSTIAGNSADDAGGIRGVDSIDHTIVANNIATAGNNADIYTDINQSLTANWSLIETVGNATVTGTNNLTGVDPLLGDLADNGGATPTHALLDGSPALDAGDPSAAEGVGAIPATDQRGAGYLRVFGSAIDIGAVEQLPDVLVVDTLSDVSNGDTSPGNLSIREALEIANAKPGPDFIAFDASLSGGTITQNNGVLVIDSEVTITGPGADLLTIDAASNSRVLRIDSGGVAAISGLTLTRGSIGRGGGVRNDGAATLTEVVVTNNRTTVGSLNAGGGIYNIGTLTLVRSTVSGNLASSANGAGGGIWNDGTLVIDSSTISGNTASKSGGGVGTGSGTTTIRYSTIADNTASNSGGGGLFVDTGSVSLSHTIVAGNAASDNSKDASGTITANWSLLQTVTGAVITGSNNLLGVDPLLGPLQDNGGPTPTHALQSTSPAIDAGDSSLVVGAGDVPGGDQRGLPYGRIAGGAIDLGAVETMPDSLVVSSAGDGIDGDFTAGEFTLREAIALSAALAGPDAITFDASLAGSTILLTEGELLVDDDLTVTGLGADQLTINAQGNSRVFLITDGVSSSRKSVAISGLTLTDGRTRSSDATENAGRGGAIHSYEDLTLSEVHVVDSESDNDGGGVWSRYGNLTIERSTVSGNTARFYGGGIYSRGGSLTIVSSTISGNQLTAGNSGVTGGGVYATGNSSSIAYSTIAGNASRRGGGIAGIDSLQHSIVADNSADDGPDIYGSIAAEWSLIEDASGATVTGDHNLLSVDPLLLPLATYGGPTPTHALRFNSPAIDAGDPSVSDPPTFDERGSSFPRVQGEAIDLGALETTPLVNPGDFNSDGAVNLADYTVWRDNLGAADESAITSHGDGLNGIDSLDYELWKANFGNQYPLELAAVVTPTSATDEPLLPLLATEPTASAVPPAATDAALAAFTTPEASATLPGSATPARVIPQDGHSRLLLLLRRQPVSRQSVAMHHKPVGGETTIEATDRAFTDVWGVGNPLWRRQA